MKKIAGLLLVFGFVLAIPALKLHAQKPFEGTLTWALTIPIMDSDNHSMIMNIKGDKTEIEMDMGDEGGLVRSYTDLSTKKRYMVMTELKKGTVSDIDDSVRPDTTHDSLNINSTGQKANIAGYSSEEYISNEANGEASFWVTADIPKDVEKCFYQALSNSPGQDAKAIKEMKYLDDRGLVPVRIIIRLAGQTMMTVEFVKYERKSLDDGLFMPPTDIKYDPLPSGGDGGEN